MMWHAGPLEAVVDKVKDVLGIDESVDENILEYCSLDKAVSVRSIYERDVQTDRHCISSSAIRHSAPLAPY